jgi:peptidoglycan/LPS O-acetylase OafA/YrhL
LPGAKKGWIRAERLCAAVLALFALAVLYPDLARFSDVRARIRAPYPWGVFGCYAAFAGGVVACIVIGQNRSRALRVAGWIVLLVFVLLELRV